MSTRNGTLWTTRRSVHSRPEWGAARGPALHASGVDTALLAAAGRIDDATAVLRFRVQQVARYTALVRWQGAAASSYLGKFDGVSASVLDCAAHADAFAELVRRRAAQH